ILGHPGIAYVFSDADELIQLRDPLAADYARLEELTPERHRKVGYGVVGGLPAPVRHDRGIAEALCECYGVIRIRDRADLVGLDKYGVSRKLLHALLDPVHVGHE